MATKPVAARGKTTRKGALGRAALDLKKILTGLKTRQVRSKPGATDSATRLKLEKPPRKRLMKAAPPIRRPDRSPPNRRSFGDDLENIRGRADKIAETIIDTFPMVGVKPMRKLFDKKNSEDEMADGGEVMDLTTEVEVE